MPKRRVEQLAASNTLASRERENKIARAYLGSSIAAPQFLHEALRNILHLQQRLHRHEKRSPAVRQPPAKVIHFSRNLTPGKQTTFFFSKLFSLFFSRNLTPGHFIVFFSKLPTFSDFHLDLVDLKRLCVSCACHRCSTPRTHFCFTRYKDSSL